jgi:hypothetical protein
MYVQISYSLLLPLPRVISGKSLTFSKSGLFTLNSFGIWSQDSLQHLLIQSCLHHLHVSGISRAETQLLKILQISHLVVNSDFGQVIFYYVYEA